MNRQKILATSQSPKQSWKDKADQDIAETQAEPSPNFYRECGEEPETDMNESATSITSSAASVGKISATEFRSVPEVNNQDNTEVEVETSTMETITGPSPAKKVRSMDWYKTTIQPNQLKSIDQKIHNFQKFNTNSQASPALAARGTSTPMCSASTSGIVKKVISKLAIFNPAIKQKLFKMTEQCAEDAPAGWTAINQNPGQPNISLGKSGRWPTDHTFRPGTLELRWPRPW